MPDFELMRAETKYLIFRHCIFTKINAHSVALIVSAFRFLFIQSGHLFSSFYADLRELKQSGKGSIRIATLVSFKEENLHIHIKLQKISGKCFLNALNILV